MWPLVVAIVLVVAALGLFLVLHSFSPEPDVKRLEKQSYIIKTAALNEGDVYRSMSVKDGELMSEPWPGVRTLYDIFQ